MKDLSFKSIKKLIGENIKNNYLIELDMGYFNHKGICYFEYKAYIYNDKKLLNDVIELHDGETEGPEAANNIINKFNDLYKYLKNNFKYVSLSEEEPII